MKVKVIEKDPDYGPVYIIVARSSPNEINVSVGRKCGGDGRISKNEESLESMRKWFSKVVSAFEKGKWISINSGPFNRTFKVSEGEIKIGGLFARFEKRK